MHPRCEHICTPCIDVPRLGRELSVDNTETGTVYGMSTRGAVGYVIAGVEKILYNHYDAHYGALGADVLQLVVANDDAALLAGAQNLHVLDRDVPVGAHGEALGVPRTALPRDVLFNPATLRDTLAGVCYDIDSSAFLEDSLFCEWAYILNCDTLRVEIYHGLNEDRAAPGRYAKFGGKPRAGGTYWGVALACELPFDLVRKIGVHDSIELLRVALGETAIDD